MQLCESVGAFYAALFLVMPFCGLRIWEVTGLQRADLDLERRRLLKGKMWIWLFQGGMRKWGMTQVSG